VPADALGGNCVPVSFFGAAPQEKNVARESYAPNLHGIWDTDIVERFAHGETPQQFADQMGIRFKARIPAWLRERVDVVSWAWESHQVAEDSVSFIVSGVRARALSLSGQDSLLLLKH
jgi:S1/P1 Nuclease